MYQHGTIKLSHHIVEGLGPLITTCQKEGFDFNMGPQQRNESTLALVFPF